MSYQAQPIDFESPAGHLMFRDALFYKKRRHDFRLVGSPTPVLEVPIADSHAHLQMISDPALSLARCAVHRVDFVVTVADPSERPEETYDGLDTWRAEALRILPEVFKATRSHLQNLPTGAVAPDEGGAPGDEALSFRCPCTTQVPEVRIACGLHPHNAKEWSPDLEQRLRSLLADPRTSVLGEVGLDYHYDLSPRDQQRDVFRRQVALAHECGLPLMLHIRDAHDDAFQILEEEGWPTAGVELHCCSIGAEELKPWLDRGAYAAFGGAITFKSSDAIRTSAVATPEDRLLLETDSPYMTPVPFRGQECGPEHTVFTAAHLAQLRGCEPGEGRAALLAATYRTTRELFDRTPTGWQQSNFAG
ncbi:Uncharacterized deoxyribonuclease YcfH [Slackia heliotrinireducens]|nr:TatD family hydrolase [Slackia heliotrinireducens]VEG99503.1 Uncharacterized deoxyribonuclease YcfH [Slackia heliotrinireducens]